MGETAAAKALVQSLINMLWTSPQIAWWVVPIFTLMLVIRVLRWSDSKARGGDDYDTTLAEWHEMTSHVAGVSHRRQQLTTRRVHKRIPVNRKIRSSW